MVSVGCLATPRVTLPLLSPGHRRAGFRAAELSQGVMVTLLPTAAWVNAHPGLSEDIVESRPASPWPKMVRIWWQKRPVLRQ
jgi:hypothetical protein